MYLLNKNDGISLYLSDYSLQHDIIILSEYKLYVKELDLNDPEYKMIYIVYKHFI